MLSTGDAAVNESANFSAGCQVMTNQHSRTMSGADILRRREIQPDEEEREEVALVHCLEGEKDSDKGAFGYRPGEVGSATQRSFQGRRQEASLR